METLHLEEYNKKKNPEQCEVIHLQMKIEQMFPGNLKQTHRK